METLFAIYIILFILSILLTPFTNVSKSILRCGLIGFAGWEKPDLNKLKLIFFANDSRGKDSCGYYYNKFIMRDVGLSYKMFQEVVIKNDDVDNFVFIGHTRQGTVGIASVNNAHPFNINNRWIVAHNGTLDNWKELCDKYEVDYKDIQVDSKALGTLIDKQGFSILNEYRGYAALLMHDMKEPNVFYAYHGKSKEYPNGIVEGERPLYYMETKEGVYFSSLEEALKAIRDDENQKPVCLPFNKVHKFEYGNLNEAESFIVERENNNIGIKEKKTVVYYYPPAKVDVEPKKSASFSPSVDIISKGLNIFKETMPKGGINLEKLIYYRNQYWVASEKKLELADGELLTDKFGYVYSLKTNDSHERYFVNGYLFDSKKAAEDYHTEMVGKNPSSWNLAFFLSKYTKYAVINQPEDGKELYTSMKNRFYLKGKLANTSIQPVFSDRTYVYRQGVLINITSESKEITIDGKVMDMFKSSESDEVNRLYKYMEKRWISRQQMDAELPPEVRWAVKLYINDIFKDSLINITDDDKFHDEVYKLVEIFLNETVESKFTIAENMEGGNRDAIEYLKDATKFDDLGIQVETETEDIQEFEKKTRIELFLKREIPSLRDLADSLQTVDSNKCQNRANRIYKFIDKVLDSKDKDEVIKLIDKYQKDNRI